MHPYYHDHPDVYELEVPIIDARRGAVLVDRSPFFPGGGGQLPDRGWICWSKGEIRVHRIISTLDGVWHESDELIEPNGPILLRVDRSFRGLMSELHTVAHILNSIVFRNFNGALLTGAQLDANGTFRLDFDLPGVENSELRSLEGEVNSVIKNNYGVTAGYITKVAAEATPGIYRSKFVSPPPQQDGRVRVVEIKDLDRQACGGTHLLSTGYARPIKIVKVDNKGKQNRRIRVARLVDS